MFSANKNITWYNSNIENDRLEVNALDKDFMSERY